MRESLAVGLKYREIKLGGPAAVDLPFLMGSQNLWR